MATCENFSTCSFYQGEMDINTDLGMKYKTTYCEGDKTLCARYIIATQLGPEYVTNSIYPNRSDLADSLIAKHKK